MNHRALVTRRGLLGAGLVLAGPAAAEAPFSPWALAWSPDGKLLACGGGDQTLYVWDFETRKRLASLKGHEDAIFTVAWSPGGALLASGGRGETTLRLWSAQRLEPRRTSTPHPRWVWCARFSPDGRHLATCGGDALVRLLRLPDLAVERELKGHRDTVKRVAWTADSKRLVSGGDDGFVHIWDAESGEELHRLAGHASWIDALVTGPRHLALSGGGDGTIRLWDTSEGRQIRQFEGRVTDLAALALSPDGELAASGGADGKLRLWMVSTGTEIAARPVKATALDLSFSPKGKWLASAHREDAVRLWTYPDLVEAAALRP